MNLRFGETERVVLQFAVAVAGLVPVAAGFAGVVVGTGLVGVTETISPLDSHWRYLSGLLLGIGIAFWSLVPQIETQGRVFRLLTAIVVIGGVGRGVAVAINGWPDPPMMAALVMELIVTPALCVWQARIAARARRRRAARPSL